MLCVTPEQMALLSRAATVDAVRAYLHQHFPDSAALPPDELEDGIQRMADAAAGHGFTQIGHVKRFAALGWLLGLDFETDMPAVREKLADDGSPPEERMRRTEEMVFQALDILYGDAP